MSDIQTIMTMIKEKEIQYVDFRFTDIHGKWHHTAQHVCTINEDIFEDGVMFDGSSIPGWKAINESDMLLMPDVSSAYIDPFAAQPLLILICDVLDPITRQAYSRDPRSIAKKALNFMGECNVGDTAYFGPEAEFFVFDDVLIKNDMNHCMYEIRSEEGPYASGDDMEGGNYAHRPSVKGGYFPVAPVDSGQDLRAEMVTVLNDLGVEMEKHHHEVAPSQHELGMKFSTMIDIADKMQLYKYVVHMVAHSYGKTATFMPKPVVGDNGSGMHVHQSIWKDGKNTFAGSLYADLSETCLHYIGGILKHSRAINAFSNPSTNSYKRLVPGYEAPVLLAYSARNRSASCRIPYSASPHGKRVETRFPDPVANPYLCYAALLMAGLDGVRNKIHPGEAMDKDLYDLPAEELRDIPTVARNLREALESLDADREFLKQGDVMNDDFIDSYIALKMAEVERLDLATHPLEYEMYYSS